MADVTLHEMNFPKPSPEENRCRRAWLEYYVRCEEFDRTLPGGWSKRDPDCWMPRGDVMSKSVRFARLEREKLTEELRATGLPLDIIERERWITDRLTFAQAKRELERMRELEGERDG